MLSTVSDMQDSPLNDGVDISYVHEPQDGHSLSFLNYVSSSSDFKDLQVGIEKTMAAVAEYHGLKIEGTKMFFGSDTQRYLNFLFTVNEGSLELQFDIDISMDDITEKEKNVLQDLLDELNRGVGLQNYFTVAKIKDYGVEAIDVVDGVDCNKEVCSMIKTVVRDKEYLSYKMNSYLLLVDILKNEKDFSEIVGKIEQNGLDVFLFKNNRSLYKQLGENSSFAKEDLVLGIIKDMILDQQTSIISFLKRREVQLKEFIAVFGYEDYMDQAIFRLNKEEFERQLNEVRGDILSFEGMYTSLLGEISVSETSVEVLKRMLEKIATTFGKSLETIDKREKEISQLSKFFGNAYRSAHHITSGVRNMSNRVLSVGKKEERNKAFVDEFEWLLKDVFFGVSPSKNFHKRTYYFDLI